MWSTDPKEAASNWSMNLWLVDTPVYKNSNVLTDVFKHILEHTNYTNGQKPGKYTPLLEY